MSELSRHSAKDDLVLAEIGVRRAAERESSRRGARLCVCVMGGEGEGGAGLFWGGVSL
jgi:hypothetical protein